MRDGSHFISTGEEDRMVLLLAWVAGGMDAISYVGLGHVFTANMTGNTVLLGLALGQGEGLAAIRSLIALGGYGLGVVAGAMIVDRHRRGQAAWSPAVTRGVLLEAAIVAAFTATWHLSVHPLSKDVVGVLILLSAAAMGVQSTAVQRLGLPGIVTTYITGTLTSLFTGLVSRRKSGASEDPIPWERRLALQASVVVVYGAAAAASSILQLRFPAAVTFSPLLAISLVVGSALGNYRRRSSSG